MRSIAAALVAVFISALVVVAPAQADTKAGHCPPMYLQLQRHREPYQPDTVKPGDTRRHVVKVLDSAGERESLRVIPGDSDLGLPTTQQEVRSFPGLVGCTWYAVFTKAGTAAWRLNSVTGIS